MLFRSYQTLNPCPQIPARYPPYSNTIKPITLTYTARLYDNFQRPTNVANSIAQTKKSLQISAANAPEAKPSIGKTLRRALRRFHFWSKTPTSSSSSVVHSAPPFRAANSTFAALPCNFPFVGAISSNVQGTIDIVSATEPMYSCRGVARPSKRTVEWASALQAR